MFEQLGFRPGRRYALAAGAAEAGGGLLFALGAATPLGTAAVSGSTHAANPELEQVAAGLRSENVRVLGLAVDPTDALATK